MGWYTVWVCLIGHKRYPDKARCEGAVGHIADGSLVLCDGLCSCHTFPGIADCALFSAVYLNSENIIKRLTGAVLIATSTD